jgi:hypothetical protein
MCHILHSLATSLKQRHCVTKRTDEQSCDSWYHNYPARIESCMQTPSHTQNRIPSRYEKYVHAKENHEQKPTMDAS